MSYSGTTAASTLANPPLQIARGVGGVNTISTGTGGGRGLWFYGSSNGSTELVSNTFFTDAFYLGMKAGDVVIGVHATGSSVGVSLGVIGAVTTLGAGVASTGGQIASSR
jgi:hypothetical protein